MGSRLRRVDAALTRWLTQEWPWLRWLLLLALVAAVVAALGPLPAWFTRHPSHGMTAAERLKATNDVRTTLVQALGGLALLGGLFFTARTFGLGAKNLGLAVEEQLTERYTKAVEQLGSEKLDVRLGGIYALERLMVDSERDHPTIVEVLTAFLREHATTPTEAASAPSSPLAFGSVAQERTVPPAPMPADTAAATRVIARRPPGRDERGPLDLRRCYLSGADLSDAHLSDADLSDASLSHANLSHASLFRAHLFGARLSHASLFGARLSDASLFRARLSDASLFRADLSDANLSDAHVFRANLSNANLSDVVGLTREQLEAAAISEGARLPEYLAEADRQYRRALEINEELGNRADMASTSSQLGVLLTEEDDVENAVGYNARSLAIRLAIGSPSARIDRHWLRRQQELLGDTRFDELLHSQLDEPSVANLKDYLSQAATDDQGVQQHLSQWDPLIADVVATIEGDEDAAARLPPLLDELGATSDWGALVAVLRRILAGERGEQLVVGLDAVGTAIAHETLWWVTNGPRAGNPRRAKAAEQQR